MMSDTDVGHLITGVVISCLISNNRRYYVLNVNIHECPHKALSGVQKKPKSVLEDMEKWEILLKRL